jgi:hypothetical protein
MQVDLARKRLLHFPFGSAVQARKADVAPCHNCWRSIIKDTT